MTTIIKDIVTKEIIAVCFSRAEVSAVIDREKHLEIEEDKYITSCIKELLVYR